LKNSQKVSFFLILAGFIVFVGLLIALFLPEIRAWRYSVVDRLLLQAKATTDDNQQYSLIEQANVIGYNDPQAIEATAQFWLKRGDTQKALQVYIARLQNPNYTALGSLALKSQDYTYASKLYAKAYSQQESASAGAGLAIALFNQNKIAEGCEKATGAYKLDLQDASIQNAVTLCLLLDTNNIEASNLVTKPVLSDREAAYFLINNKVYKLGEENLLKVKTKSVSDWLIMSRLAASRGDFNDAISKAEQGIELDRSNIDLNRDLVKLYTLTNNASKQREYSNRLEQLQFSKYQ